MSAREASAQERDLSAALSDAADVLAQAGVASARVDAELIAAHLLGLNPGELRAAAIRGAAVPARFDELIYERARRVPLQHLTGKAPFAELTLAVGPGVFVPRPETECVAVAARDAVRERGAADGAGATIVDLCTGSGAIAAALATWLPGARVVAVELDPLAHAWAERNLAGLGVELHVGDALSALGHLDGQVDLVVSNPPYVPQHMVPRDIEVAEHDPRLALYGGGEDGFALPRRIVARAASLLAPGGTLVMEHGDEQGELARRAAAATGHLMDIRTKQDLSGRDRMVIARRI